MLSFCLTNSISSQVLSFWSTHNEDIYFWCNSAISVRRYDEYPSGHCKIHSLVYKPCCWVRSLQIFEMKLIALNSSYVAAFLITNRYTPAQIHFSTYWSFFHLTPPPSFPSSANSQSPLTEHLSTHSYSWLPFSAEVTVWRTLRHLKMR